MFESTLLPFQDLAIFFTAFFLCFTEETLKAIGPFYLVSMPGEWKTSGVDSLTLSTDTMNHQSCYWVLGLVGSKISEMK